MCNPDPTIEDALDDVSRAYRRYWEAKAYRDGDFRLYKQWARQEDRLIEVIRVHKREEAERASGSG